MTNDRPTPNLLGRAARLRLLTFLATLSALYVVADVFELPWRRDDFQADPTVLGILIGATLAIGGIEVLSRFPGFGPNKGGGNGNGGNGNP